MKNSCSLSAVVVLALLVFPAAGFAQQPPPPLPLVTTTGSAEIQVAPDLVDLSFDVEVRNVDLTAALKEQTERAAKVLATLRAAGIAEKELGTTQTQISVNYAEKNEETARVQYYDVTQEVTCTLHDVKKVSDLTAAVVAAGATGVSPATLRTSELRQHRDEARRKAVVAAREKATLLAEALGAKVGPPYSITEFASGYYGGGQSNALSQSARAVPEVADDGAGGSTYVAGFITVSATVNVSFVLQ